MALINSLFSGVSGLRNHQSMLDVIGNNIANVNSIGFKGSRVTFSDTFNQFVRSGSNPGDTSGGTNTFQVGLGMKLNSVDRNWNQGTFERTGIVTDLALQGDGLFIFENNNEKFYSRAGALSFDADGKLVNPQNGAILQGKMATNEGVVPPGNNLEDIEITPDLKLPAVATSLIEWGGNLDSTATITRSESVVQTGNINDGADSTSTMTIYDVNGNEFTLTAAYTNTGAGTYDLDLSMVDSDGNNVALEQGGGALGTLAVVFDTATGDMQSLDGNNPPVAITNISAAGGDVQFNFDPTALTNNAATTTVSSSVDANREPTIVTGTLSIFDSLGNSHTLSLQFTKTADGNWNWNADVPASSGILDPGTNSGTVTFNADGSVNTISPNPPVLTFTPSGGASQQTIELNFGEDFDGITQTSSNSVVSALSQDGSSAATLSDISIDSHGYIVGVFSNGFSRNLAQIMLATFPNNNGLTSVGENMFTVSANAGSAFIGEPGDATNTTIQSGALEQSNVDLSEEFSRMIVSQRGFQANARIITVSDQLLQETTNLVR